LFSDLFIGVQAKLLHTIMSLPEEKNTCGKFHPAFLLVRPVVAKNQENAIATDRFLHQYLTHVSLEFHPGVILRDFILWSTAAHVVVRQRARASNGE
jgi:hypothetical protein